MPRGKYASTRQQRIDWLLSHTELWDRHGELPHPRATNVAQLLDADGIARMQALVRAMRAAGLYSKHTYVVDVWASARDCIQIARQQRQGRQVLCAYCGAVVGVEDGRALSHLDFYPTRLCEGGNRCVRDGRMVTGDRDEMERQHAQKQAGNRPLDT